MLHPCSGDKPNLGKASGHPNFELYCYTGSQYFFLNCGRNVGKGGGLSNYHMALQFYGLFEGWYIVPVSIGWSKHLTIQQDK